jgi:hypothetical protein
VYFLHQGVELGETRPVNTGLGFTPEDIAALPSHKLPLFSESWLCWDNPGEMSKLVETVAAIRARWELVIIDHRRESFKLLKATNEHAICFARTTPDGKHVLAVIANSDCEHAIGFDVHIPGEHSAVTDAISGAELAVTNGSATVQLAPGQTMVLELTKPLV